MVKQRPLVGISNSVLNGFHQHLMGIRVGSHGSGTWSTLGGHLEFGETTFECARRECYEEGGFDITDLRFSPYNEIFFEEEDKQYIDIVVVSRYNSSHEPIVKEPDKCLGWEWVAWEEFRNWKRERPLFKPLEVMLQKSKKIDPWGHVL